MSTTTDMVMMTKITAAAALTWSPTPSQSGRASTAARASTPPPQRTARTSGSLRSSWGTGRTSSDTFQLDEVSWSARVEPTLRTSRVTTMTSARMGSTISGLRGLFQVMPWVSRPMATAEAVTAGRSVRLPSMRAASAASSTLRLRVVMTGRPWMPACRKMPTNDRRAASDHTTVCRRLTGTPSRLARSAFSALARMATPMLVNRSRAATPSRASGATMRATRWSDEKTMGSMVKWKVSGKWTWLVAGRLSQMSGMNTAPSDRSWARPRVATVRMRRGERKNRRMMASSTRAPTSRAPTIPMASERK